MREDTRRPQLAVGVFVFDAAGRVLLVQRGRPPAQGQWSVPGGKVEWGESVAAACRREVREETGIDVELGPLVTWIERMDDAHHYVILDFVAVPRGDHAQPIAGDDAADARWLHETQLDDVPLTAGLRQVLRQARALCQPV
ncbi:NUDIX hydrolase [Immundisolibacter sp.]|uniref:NUDIX hydrolase n=1 Tax=Immundisolibacter sp. TaxID=1934948 RepID=UPI003F82E766